ncbi:TraM recognition domain-containing protein [Acanthopleuribacter pedis]|uniref:ATP-binding protein n=1 Tax=Acanthopleuribacter pedis TaxID=442870 RepID=A0A8J7Q5L4_9BACT|nr:type IV secretory system conjugative DNA transfer family protein [Acanthopleuribacter pedis]MBO1318309.1 ATP-binding protein [Acanthopleuribacter pedis]
MKFWKLLLGLEKFPTTFTPTKNLGWWRVPFLHKWIAVIRLKWLLPLPALRRHAAMFSKSGSGKSYFLYLFLLTIKIHWGVWPWVPQVNSRRSLLLFDPHGDLAEKCAQNPTLLREALRAHRRGKAPNLMFISPTLCTNSIPCCNPFDRRGKRDSKATREVLAQYLTSTFAAMLSRGDVSLSFRMEALLTPMFTVLLAIARQGREVTFFDLLRFLKDDQNRDLVEFGMKKLKNPGMNLFFRETFMEKQLVSTKFALRVKLAKLLSSRMFVRLLCQKQSSWDLETALNSGKTVLIDGSVSQLGREVSEIYGRTITALTQAYAFLRARRRHQKFMPIYFIVDEAASFLTEDVRVILTQARKFGLHLILCQQMVKQAGMSQDMHETIMGNTALKVVGNAGHTTKKVLAAEMEVPLADLTHLSVGSFVLKADGRGHRRVKLPSFWLKEGSKSLDRTWAKVKPILLSHYSPDAVAGEGPGNTNTGAAMTAKRFGPKFNTLPFRVVPFFFLLPLL